MQKLKSRWIFKLIMNARNAAGGVLSVLFIASVLLLGGPLAHATSVEKMKPSVVAVEAVKDEKPSLPPERLYGIWTANDVDVKMGQVKIRLTLRQEEKVSVMAWSDILFVRQVRDLKGTFFVNGDTISSEAIRDGKKAKFSFENEQLVLRFKSGIVVRFDRE